MLHGRMEEITRTAALLDQARSGRSGALVLRGEAGIGKSALLDHAAHLAGDMRVLRTDGIESEAGFPYAGLHLLLGRETDRLDALPVPQARALRAALGQEAGGDANGFLVGLAVLTLLAELAEERPLLCLVDDAHWLDAASAEALLFAVRRLDAEAIAVVVAVRADEPSPFDQAGLPELPVGPLGEAAAAALVGQRPEPVPGYLLSDLLTEAQGNPLALLELPLDGEPRRVPSSRYQRLHQVFAERVRRLPEATRRLLGVVADASTADAAVVLAAAERLGCTRGDLAPAEQAQLVRLVDGRLVFRHPLVRTALRETAEAGIRMAAHEALAAVYAARGDVCSYAWHRSVSAVGPDEDAAAALETAARSGSSRVSAVASAMYERAAALTADRARRGQRLTVAAEAAADAGQLDRAAALADQAADYVADPVQLADIALVRATVLDSRDRPKEAHRLLSDAAVAVASLDPRRAGHLLFRAGRAAAHADDLGALDRTAARAEELGVPSAHLVTALSRVIAAQHALSDASVAPLRVLVEATTGCAQHLELLDIGWWHLMLADLDDAHDVAARLADTARQQGAAGLLASVLPLLARTQLMSGRHDDAEASATEGLRIAADTGQRRHAVYLNTVLAALAAVTGDEERCVELTAEPVTRGVTPGNVHAAGALSLLDLGLGRYESAFARLSGVLAAPRRGGAMASLPDLVEAAVRVDRPADGLPAARRYAEWAAHVRQPWTRAVALRCQALLDGNADDQYAQAVALHRQGGPPFERARTELLHGEWLRRARRITEARIVLHSALEIFDRLQARPWSARARAELRAAGESVRAADTGAVQRLTPQEHQVVQLAARGLSNREIGAQLFLSPRTVGYHLYKAYPKLGVGSRSELASLVADQPDRSARVGA
ncbi:AAA family ATPase [Micromonospora sp. C31]|uniref:AAA family ATPase n=1 Tax=Micromonospora sp. C31 TaxID=2824876 RepID=UPI001B36775A|nr:LuxR family transcriptional regulator [Micromonospora sp. C31]MBQ1074036.1 AAA family ATPase [Micromonospora sp. C31]